MMTNLLAYVVRVVQLLALPLGGALIAIEASQSVYPCIGMEYNPWKLAIFTFLTTYWLLKESKHYPRKP